MTAGSLRHRVTIQRRTLLAARDAATGERAEEWDDVATVWACIEPLAGRELWQARQVQSDQSHRVTVRYSALTRGTTTADRLTYADPGAGAARTFNISGVRVPDESREWVEFACQEGV